MDGKYLLALAGGIGALVASSTPSYASELGPTPDMIKSNEILKKERQISAEIELVHECRQWYLDTYAKTPVPLTSQADERLLKPCMDLVSPHYKIKSVHDLSWALTRTLDILHRRRGKVVGEYLAHGLETRMKRER